MKSFIKSEFIKFEIEILELIQYIKKINLLTMNMQTYLSINILVLLGIEANIFFFSVLLDKIYNQEYYTILFYVGHILYLLFVFITNYMRLNYLNKTSFNWVNAFIIILLIRVLISDNSTTIFNSKNTIDYLLGDKVVWSVDTPSIFFPLLMGIIVLFAFGIDKLWGNRSTIESNGIIFDNKVIDVWWGNRTDLTDEQVKILRKYDRRINKYPFWLDIYRSIIYDSLCFYGRSTVRQWQMFNVYVTLIIYNFIITYTIGAAVLRYTLYIYLTYTIINMICRRLMDSNSSVFWFVCIFVPLVNIYVMYLLYNKTSAVYDRESNTIFYYPL